MFFTTAVNGVKTKVMKVIVEYRLKRLLCKIFFKKTLIGVFQNYIIKNSIILILWKSFNTTSNCKMWYTTNAQKNDFTSLVLNEIKMY